MSGILVSIDLGICTITLNRPEKYNSFVREMALALQATIDACKDDPEVRVVIITGAGKAFCAGQDRNEAIDPEGPELQKIVA
jgi:2-(1,2-epoxy-1,2-dihydrophenyl)acetyl-CoA isomerase